MSTLKNEEKTGYFCSELVAKLYKRLDFLP